MSEDLVAMAVDREACVGVGQCELLEPQIFRIDDGDGLAVVVGSGRLPREQAAIVIDKCPSGAISIA